MRCNLTRDCFENRDRRRLILRTKCVCTAKRPRQWASRIPIIPTKWVDEKGAKQRENCSRLCEKELERSSSNVKCATFDMRSRKITFLDASAKRWVGAVRVRKRLSYNLMSKQVWKSWEDYRIRCLRYEKKCAIGRKFGDKCS